jgi:hypothetical protein
MGPEHVFLALLKAPSVAADTLVELGVTLEKANELAQHARSLSRQPDTEAKHVQPNPAMHALHGCVAGFAAAFGHETPSSEDWLLAIAYLQGNVLAFCGTASSSVVEALRDRGVRVPELEPPVYRPMRDVQDVEVAEAELSAVIEGLRRRHPPGSEWRWGFNWTDDEPRRARIIAEGGIELDQIIADAGST